MTGNTTPDTPAEPFTPPAEPEPGTAYLMVPRSAALAIPTPAELETMLGMRQLDMRNWLAAIVEREALEETDTEDAALSIVRTIITAETSEQVYAAMDMLTAKDLCGEDPGGRSNVLEIRGAFPLASTFDEGPGCFIVVSARDLSESRDITFSCGARAVQAAIWAHIARGWMPMRCSLVRRRKPTRNGFYPLNLESGI